MDWGIVLHFLNVVRSNTTHVIKCKLLWSHVLKTFTNCHQGDISILMSLYIIWFDLLLVSQNVAANLTAVLGIGCGEILVQHIYPMYYEIDADCMYVSPIFYARPQKILKSQSGLPVVQYEVEWASGQFWEVTLNLFVISVMVLLCVRCLNGCFLLLITWSNLSKALT